MKKILVLVLMTLLVTVVYAQRKNRTTSVREWDEYEIAVEKVGVEGTKFVKVWGSGKDVDAAVLSAKRNAVHACLFRGLLVGTDVNATPAICRDPRALEDHIDYFERFFAADGPFLNYVNVTTDGVPSGQDRRQVKGGFKVAIYAQVLYDDLKRQMENDGIIRKLSTYF